MPHQTPQRTASLHLLCNADLVMANKAKRKDNLFPYVGQPKSPAYMWLPPSVVRDRLKYDLDFFKSQPAVVNHMNHSSFTLSLFLFFFIILDSFTNA